MAKAEVRSDEQRLLAQARAWDMEALARIYDDYSPGLYRYAMRLLGDQDLAEECVAETFSRFLHALRAGRGPHRHLQAYLYRIAHNWVTDYFRRRAREAEWPERPLPDPSAGPDTLARKRLEQARVRRLLRRLTPAQQQVVVLYYLEGWSHEEIARTLRRSVGAVKALQHRAVRALHRWLMEEVQAGAPLLGEVHDG